MLKLLPDADLGVFVSVNTASAGAPSAAAFADYVDDLVRVARAAPSPPWVIGHSLGAGVGIGAATRTPLAGLVHLAGVWQFAAHNQTLRGLAAASLAVEGPLAALGARVSTAWAGRALGRLYSITEIAGFGFPISGWTPDAIERPLLAERLNNRMSNESLLERLARLRAEAERAEAI